MTLAALINVPVPHRLGFRVISLRMGQGDALQGRKRLQTPFLTRGHEILRAKKEWQGRKAAAQTQSVTSNQTGVSSSGSPL